MENKLNVQKLGYEVGEPMWVHWDDRYVWRGGHILGECPDENLITTFSYLLYSWNVYTKCSNTRVSFFAKKCSI